MIFEEFSSHRAAKKVIIVHVMALIPCPLNILFSPSITVPVIHQAKHQINPILLSFCYHKIQTLKKMNQIILKMKMTILTN